MTEPDYAALRAMARRGRRRIYSPEVAEARHPEQGLRNSVAQKRALYALARAHPEDYRSLYEQAKPEVAAERGPLPGDPS